MKLRYSDKNSAKFWRKIASIENQETHDLLYIAGCALQEHEKRVWQMLRTALSHADGSPIEKTEGGAS